MSDNAERGSEMTVERAIALYGGLSKWLTDRIGEGEVCSCGHCHLCAYNFLKGQAEEIARLTERCDAYREALEHTRNTIRELLKPGGMELVAGEMSAQERRAVRAILEYVSRQSAALASPAGEQKDKTL